MKIVHRNISIKKENSYSSYQSSVFFGEYSPLTREGKLSNKKVQSVLKIVNFLSKVLIQCIVSNRGIVIILV